MHSLCAAAAATLHYRYCVNNVAVRVCGLASFRVES